MCKYYAFKGPLEVIVMCKYYAFKGATNSNCNVYVLCFQRGSNSNFIVQVLNFQRDPTTISNVQIKKNFKPTSIPENCELKFLSKSCEKTLSNKRKYVYQIITFPNK